MDYRITLTKAERVAIDWNGDDLYCLLWLESTTHTPEDAEWDDESDITFDVPEHVAWDINDLWNGMPCFAEELSEKLMAFIGSIV